METLLNNLIRKPLLNQMFFTFNKCNKIIEINDDFSKERLFCRKKIKIDNPQLYFEKALPIKCENKEQNQVNVCTNNDNIDINVLMDEQKQELMLECHLENSIQYISGETLVQTMNEHDVIIYDCRYQYEFQGGHIRGAIHLDHFTNLFEELFGASKQSKKIVVLYCEFSIKRSQEKYFEIRNLDRSINQYPKLTYNNLYLLSKGYSEFYKNFSHMCDGNYITMMDIQYEQELEQEQQLRNIIKQRNRLNKSKQNLVIKI